VAFSAGRRTIADELVRFRGQEDLKGYGERDGSPSGGSHIIPGKLSA